MDILLLDNLDYLNMTMFASYESQFLQECFLFFLQAESAAPAPQPGGGMQFFLVMGLLFVGMYFLMIAPQRKKQKEHARMVSNLKSGDEILTIGGIYGTVTNLKNDRVVVKIADNTKIEINRNSIQSVLVSTEKDSAKES